MASKLLTAKRASKPVKSHKFSLDHRGEFDEVWVSNAFVHVERMGEKEYWLGIERKGMPRISIFTGVYRGKWYFNIFEDGVDGQSFQVQRPRQSERRKVQRG